MWKPNKLAISMIRLAAVAVVVASLPAVMRAETVGDGGCSTSAKHLCARLSENLDGEACNAGNGGGCVDCCAGGASDTCAYTGGDSNSGYKKCSSE